MIWLTPIQLQLGCITCVRCSSHKKGVESALIKQKNPPVMHVLSLICHVCSQLAHFYHIQYLYASVVTCVWGGPLGHIEACWGSRPGSEGRTQTTCPAACELVCWICGTPAAVAVSCPVGRSPSPEESYAGSGHRRCGRKVCRAAAPVAAGRCGTQGRHPLPGGSCRGGSPSCGGSGHIQSTEPPRSAPLVRRDPLRSLGCPSLLL